MFWKYHSAGFVPHTISNQVSMSSLLKIGGGEVSMVAVLVEDALEEELLPEDEELTSED